MPLGTLLQFTFVLVVFATTAVNEIVAPGYT